MKRATNKIKIDSFALSNCGYVRDQNEDAIFISDDQLVIAVADGIGGEPYGEVASALALQALEKMCLDEPPANLPEEDHADWIERAFDYANECLHRHARKHTETDGMGTTLIAAVMTDRGATIGHIGDCRAILIDKGFANTITRDHAECEDSTRPGRKRGGLTRALGRDYSVFTDVFSVSTSPGQTLLLCSDGLHGVVTQKEIIEIVSANPEAEECCSALVETALEYGGPDNVSVIVWRYSAD